MDLIVLGYVGPETVLPVTSVVAAVTGMVLMFGKRLWRKLAGLLSFFRKPR